MVQFLTNIAGMCAAGRLCMIGGVTGPEECHTAYLCMLQKDEKGDVNNTEDPVISA